MSLGHRHRSLPVKHMCGVFWACFDSYSRVKLVGRPSFFLGTAKPHNRALLRTSIPLNKYVQLITLYVGQCDDS